MLKNQILENLKTKKIHVIGIAGIEGSDIALFLDSIKAPKKNITLHQLTPQETLKENFFKYNQGFNQEELEERYQKLINSGFTFNFEKNYLKNIQEADIIFAPQSWYLHDSNKPLLELRNKISTITNLYFQLIPCPIISITGSNGKSTTSKLIFELINQSPDHKAWITGNDRATPSLLLKLNEIAPTDFLVTETSNRQLNFLEGHKPFISVITNITENHVSEYNSFQDYINVKLKLFQNQSKEDHLIINIDNPLLSELKTQKITPQLHQTSLSETQTECHLKDDIIYYKDEPIIHINDLNLIGQHNYSNVLQAITAAKIINISTDSIQKTLKNFYGLQNRCEIVHRSENMVFINDRQGTSVDSTTQALKSLPHPTILIFGGANKGMETDTLASNMSQEGITSIGIKSPFTDEIKPKVPSNQFHEVGTMTEAMKLAIKLAKENSETTHIIFSPAGEYGPYFDPLPGYEDAEQFNQLAKQLS